MNLRIIFKKIHYEVNAIKSSKTNETIKFENPYVFHLAYLQASWIISF